MAATSLGIGGAVLRFTAAAGTGLEPPAAPGAAFVVEPAASGAPRVEVAVRVGRPGVPAGARCAFRTGGAWSLHADGERRHLALDPPGVDAPWWVASTDTGYRRFALCCHPRLADAPPRPAVVRRLIGYPLDQMLVVHALAGRGGLLVHAAGAIGGGGRAVLFPGASGAGKTTLTRVLGGDAGWRFLSDDRMVVRAGRDGPIAAWGTPWPGDAGVAVPAGAPLGSVCLLAHGRRTRLRALPAREALAALLQVVSVPWYEPALADGALDSLERVIREVPVTRLEFRPERGELHRVLDGLPDAA